MSPPEVKRYNYWDRNTQESASFSLKERFVLASQRVDLDRELYPGLLRTVHNWEQLPLHARKLKIEQALPFLSPDVVTKVAQLDFDALKRVSNTAEGIKDALIFSTPDRLFVYRTQNQFKKLMNWAYSLEVHRPGAVTRQWKLFTGIVKWLAIKSETPQPPLPQDFPGLGTRSNMTKVPDFWLHLCPWLTAVWTKGVRSKLTMTRVCHFCSSRQLPAATKAERDRALSEHATTLFTSAETDAQRERLLFLLSQSAGSYVKARLPATPPRGAHVSLTNNSSFASPVRAGGRTKEVGPTFATWRSVRSPSDVRETTWFGMPYRLSTGRPLWQTMCREGDLDVPMDAEAGESSETWFPNLDITLGPDGKPKRDFIYEDPIYGLDEYTGYQLLQWAIEEGIRCGKLSGCPFYDETNPLKIISNPEIRASAIGEPGFKARVVTVAESWLTIALQPMSHELRALLEFHPSARAGLGRAWQLFEYVKRLAYVKPFNDRRGRYFLSSDLKTATDYCRHDYSLAMLKGFLKGVEKNTFFYNFCADLLCSPRDYTNKQLGFEKQPTARGILMGDPGTKIVLTLHNLCAEAEALLRYRMGYYSEDLKPLIKRLESQLRIRSPPWRHFVCAGDDHFGAGPKKYLELITLNHHRNGMSVSWDKNFLSRIGGFYCEEAFLAAGLKTSQVYGCKTALKDRSYGTTPHIDALKIRLFSPCSKEHDGKDEPNPAIGKARSIQGMIAWLAGGFESTKPLFAKRFMQRLSAYLPVDDMYRYLPISAGGLGCPTQHLSNSQLEQVVSSVPEGTFRLLVGILEGSAHHISRRIVSSFATNARARGLETDFIEESIREILSREDLIKCCKIDDLKPARVTQLDWDNMRYYDKLRATKSQGYLSLSEAIKMIDRPYTFRNMLYPDISRRHGIDPTVKSAYLPLPWRKRIDHHRKAIAKHLEATTIPVPDEDSVGRAKAQLFKALRSGTDLRVPTDTIVVAREAVESENLCTLTTKDINRIFLA